MDYYNKIARAFYKKYGNKRGTYSLLQEEPVWNLAKIKHIARLRKDGVLYCHRCKLAIEGNPTIHHTSYDFKHIFDNVVFVHSKCHQILHSIKNNYRKKVRI